MVTDGLVLRKRLFDLLSTTQQMRVVAAPSGFGKTTLLRTWIDAPPAGERAVVWVALSTEVASRKDFWQLVAASTARRGDLDADAHRLLAGQIDTGDDPVPTIARFVEGCSPMLLVLDAYEHLRGLTSAIDDDILRLVGAVPQLDVVVTTRAATPLTDEVLVMRGLVRLIDASDLRFTTEEAEQLLEFHAPHAVDLAERVVRDTRGYPLAVRAVAHALARLGSTPSLDDRAWQRLVTEDLKSQIANPTLVDFVLDTSVPPYFDRQLARQLTGADDVDTALAELAWNGFGRWIPYARDRPAFQYVESVRDTFLAQLRADHPERYGRIAGHTAEWLLGQDDYDGALPLAIDAGRFDLASSICRSLVLTNAGIQSLALRERHLRRVPRSLLPRYPVLAFIRGMVYASRPATRESAAEYFGIMAAHALDHIDQLTPREAFYQHVGREVCLRNLGRSKEAGAAAVAALELLDSMTAADRDQVGEILPMALGILAYSLFQVGDVDRARTVAERAVTSASAPWLRNYALSFAVGIPALDGRCRDAHAALEMIEPAPAHSDHQRRRPPHPLGITGRATLRLDEFDFSGAVREFDSTESLMNVADSWPFITWALMHARLGLGEAGTEAHRVTEALAAKPPPPGLGPNLGTAAMLNTLAILWLAAGHPAKGRPLLRTDTPFPGQLAPAKVLYQLVSGDPALAVRTLVGLLAEPGHTIRSTAAVETLGAAAARRAGNDDAALELLQRVASRYHLFGVRAHLLYVPNADLEALRALAGDRHNEACYLAGRVVTPIASPDATPVTLTRREIEALRAWAVHRTRAEVAGALFVSTNTVRSQLNSAYRKLGVTTKDAAIQRAIELDLLHPPPR